MFYSLNLRCALSLWFRAPFFFVLGGSRPLLLPVLPPLRSVVPSLFGPRTPHPPLLPSCLVCTGLSVFVRRCSFALPPCVLVFLPLFTCSTGRGPGALFSFSFPLVGGFLLDSGGASSAPVVRRPAWRRVFWALLGTQPLLRAAPSFSFFCLLCGVARLHLVSLTRRGPDSDFVVLCFFRSVRSLTTLTSSFFAFRRFSLSAAVVFPYCSSLLCRCSARGPSSHCCRCPWVASPPGFWPSRVYASFPVVGWRPPCVPGSFCIAPSLCTAFTARPFLRLPFVRQFLLGWSFSCALLVGYVFLVPSARFPLFPSPLGPRRFRVLSSGAVPWPSLACRPAPLSPAVAAVYSHFLAPSSMALMFPVLVFR